MCKKETAISDPSTSYSAQLVSEETYCAKSSADFWFLRLSLGFTWAGDKLQVPSCIVSWMLFSKESTLKQASRLVFGFLGLGLFDSLMDNDPNAPRA